jgi:hypothetical protein
MRRFVNPNPDGAKLIAIVAFDTLCNGHIYWDMASVQVGKLDSKSLPVAGRGLRSFSMGRRVKPGRDNRVSGTESSHMR